MKKELLVGLIELLVSEETSTQDVSKPQTSDSDLLSGFIGKYVICRSRNEGINAGKVVRLDNTGVVLDDAQRLYYHKPLNKNLSWYEGVAQSGISPDSKVGAKVTKVIIEDYSLTVCTEVAEKSIREAQVNEQN